MYVLLFDIDGTLISSGGAGRGALELAFATAFEVRELFPVPISGRTDRSIVSDLFREHAIEPSQGNWDRFRDHYLRYLPDQLVARPGKVLAGISPLLESLKHCSNVALGLLTGNLRAGAAIKLRHFGLNDHFAFGGFGDDHWDRNDVARMALESARDVYGQAVSVERTWVIGDTPLDIRCARSIGARVAAVATGMHPRDELAAFHPDLLLDDFSSAAPFWQALDGIAVGDGVIRARSG